MKKFLFVVILLLSVWNAKAQMTISRSDVTSAPGVTHVYRSPESFDGYQDPMRGANRFWDYMGIPMNMSSDMVMMFEAPENETYYPTASFKVQMENLARYYRISDSGIEALGEAVVESSTSMLPDGGGMITSPMQNAMWTPPINVVKFPVSYGSGWTSHSSDRMYQFATVSSLGLMGAKLDYRRDVMQTDSVVGWGMLRMPNGAYYNALLSKTTRKVSTWLKVNGMTPSPEAAAYFGMPSVTNEETWTWMVKGFPEAIMRVYKVNGQVMSIMADVTPQPCMTPMPPMLVDRSTTSLKLTWPNVDGGASYQVNYRRQGTSNMLVRNASSNMIELTNLMPGKTYEVTVQVVCPGNSVSLATQVSLFTTREMPCAVTMEAYVISPSSEGMHDGRIEVMPSGGMQPYKYSMNNGMWQMSQIFNNLMSGTYLISVMDNDGCMSMQQINVMDGMCEAPTNLSVEGVMPMSATVSWDAVMGAKRYQVRLRRMGSSTTMMRTTLDNMTMYDNLMPGMTYMASVRAECATMGNSPYSMTSFTTPMMRMAGQETVSSSMSVYPNPTKGDVSINIESASNEAASLFVADVTGRVVFSKSVDLTSGVNNLSLDLASQPAGIYVVRLQQGANSHSVKVIRN